jgi:hypothetical protein
MATGECNRACIWLSVTLQLLSTGSNLGVNFPTSRSFQRTDGWLLTFLLCTCSARVIFPSTLLRCTDIQEAIAYNQQYLFQFFFWQHHPSNSGISDVLLVRSVWVWEQRQLLVGIGVGPFLLFSPGCLYP